MRNVDADLQGGEFKVKWTETCSYVSKNSKFCQKTSCRHLTIIIRYNYMKSFFPSLILAWAEAILLTVSEIHWAHPIVNALFLEFMQPLPIGIFCSYLVFWILIYDIHNKISNLELLGHFYFWPYKRPRGRIYIFFVLKLIQQWLVGRFEGLMKGY